MQQPARATRRKIGLVFLQARDHAPLARNYSLAQAHGVFAARITRLVDNRAARRREIGVVLGEMIASNRGLGYLVQFSGAQFDTAGVFAVLIVIALLAMMLNLVVDVVQNRMERWRVVSR